LIGCLEAGYIIEEDCQVNRSNINLQDVFLNQVRKEHLPVTIYLTNGFQLKGMVKGFDNFTVILDTDGRQQLVYKHAISTISPMKLVNFIFNDNRE
jgi:host factor-I protein